MPLLPLSAEQKIEKQAPRVEWGGSVDTAAPQVASSQVKLVFTMVQEIATSPANIPPAPAVKSSLNVFVAMRLNSLETLPQHESSITDQCCHAPSRGQPEHLCSSRNIL
ncbi:MAG: hypothetical protein ACXW6R_08730 [Candidatus Binatia bacterium]